MLKDKAKSVGSFIFGEGTEDTYESLQAKRKRANLLASQASRTPTTFGGGLSALGQAIASRRLTNQANAGDKKGREEFGSVFQKLLANRLGVGQAADLYGSPYANSAHRKVISDNMPAYKYGTNHHQGGVALVGEDGPEVVELPRGSKVHPNPVTRQPKASPNSGLLYDTAPEPDQYMLEEMGPQEFNKYKNFNNLQRLQYLNDPVNGFVPPNASQDMSNSTLQPKSNFLDAGMYDVAQANTGVTSDVSPSIGPAGMSGIAPSGVGEESKLNASARSYQGLMKSLHDYEQMFQNGGSTMWPGKRRDQLGIAHRDLQMQMKELYNLGVLNGPDLDLMNQILIDPTSASGNIMDALGVADMEERIPANIQQVRQLMTNRTKPALQQLGIDPQSLMPTQEDDSAFLKRLGLE